MKKLSAVFSLYARRAWITVLLVLLAAGMALLPLAAAKAGAAIEPAPSSGTSDATAGGTIVFQVVSGGPIYAVNGDGRGLRYLTTGTDPALSPDGQWVAFTRWDDTQPGALGSLWVIRVDGSGERAILGNIHQPKSPTWSPDGTRIVVSMVEGGRWAVEEKCGSERPPRDAYDVHVHVHTDDDGRIDMQFCYKLPIHTLWGLRAVEVASGQFEDLPNDLYSYSPDWDPSDPGHLVYDGEKGLMNLDLNQGKMWSMTRDANDHSPVLSPDGSKVAVSYWQNDHWEVHVLNADGSGRVRLTEMSNRAVIEQLMKGTTLIAWNNASPVWSPDGSQIAYVTDRTGQWEIWVMNADGSNQRPLLAGDVLAGLKLQYNGMDERMLSWK